MNRLNISLDKKNIKTFLLSTRFLFQSLDRVRFYNSEGQIIGDTNILDLDQDVFSRTDTIILKSLGNNEPEEENEINKKLEKEKYIQENDISKIIMRDYLGEPIVLQNKINNNFFVSTLNKVNIKNNSSGFIMVTEQANDILIAVEERKNFILRTVFAVALVCLLYTSPSPRDGLLSRMPSSA